METISDDPSPMEGLGTGADDGTTSQQPPRAFTPPHTAAAGLQVSPADMGTAERRHAGASPSPGGPINGQPPPTAQGFLQQPQQALLSHHHHQQQQQQLLQHHQGMQSSEPSPLQQQHMMQYSMPQLQQQLPLIQSQPPQQQRAPNPATASAVNPGVVAQPPYGKYFMQRVTTNVAHVLFYVVDSRGFAKLAVVGTDVKLSGHFVYASVSDMSEASALRCTNRGKVMEWLAGLGATTPADDHEVVLPDLAPHHWQQLHSADPMWTKPQLDRKYTGYREEVGTLPDGRHFKNYYLLDDTGAEKLMVMAEDGARLDRRYTYKAVEDVGGFCFENGKAVTDWLDYILGKCELPPSFMRRQEPPERKRKKKSAEKEPTGKADSPAHQQQQQLAYVPGRASSAGRPPQVPGQLGLSEPRGPPGAVHHMYTAAASGLLRPSSAGGFSEEQQMLVERQQLLVQQQGLGAGTATGLAGFGSSAPWTPHGPGLVYSPAGISTPGCSAEDPYGNLRRDTPGPGGFALPQQRQMHPPFIQQQQMGLQGPVRGPATAAGSGYGSQGLGMEEPLSPASVTEAVAAAGAEVRAVFSADPQLLEWVTSMPDQLTVERVKGCAARLTEYLRTAGDEHGPGASDNNHELVTILQMLGATPISLRLLEMTGICRPVALLSYHSSQQVCELAARLTQQWRRVATAAHDCANAALKAPSSLGDSALGPRLVPP